MFSPVFTESNNVIRLSVICFKKSIVCQIKHNITVLKHSEGPFKCSIQCNGQRPDQQRTVIIGKDTPQCVIRPVSCGYADGISTFGRGSSLIESLYLPDQVFRRCGIQLIHFQNRFHDSLLFPGKISKKKEISKLTAFCLPAKRKSVQITSPFQKIVSRRTILFIS